MISYDVMMDEIINFFFTQFCVVLYKYFFRKKLLWDSYLFRLYI